jgi:hypothetical protein
MTDRRDEPSVMSVYDPLSRELGRTRTHTIRLTFSDIEEILGRPLPPSAYKFSAWWENEVRAKRGTRRPWRGCRQASRLEFL